MSLANTTWSERATLLYEGLRILLPVLSRAVILRAGAFFHSLTWRDMPDAKNVVVLGGSFSGLLVVEELSQRLPTGYKLVWIEKNSHLNYSFVFPRFSVMQGREQEAFIPYDGWARRAPEGMLTRIQDKATAVTNTHVLLESGRKVSYECLVLATGSSQPLPAQASSTQFETACGELQGVQWAIRAASKIAVVGGGAVGVELAADIKDFYPEKHVTLVHSRGQLLNQFGKKLQDYVLQYLRDKLKVRILLNERPRLPAEEEAFASAELTFNDSNKERFDLVLRCTGQRPNSSVMGSFLPDAISKETSRIIVRPTLQVDEDLPGLTNPIFALGDVANHGGPRMARAGWRQAQVVSDNVVDVVHGKPASHVYKPNMFMEGAIKLTLGKTHIVGYSQTAAGSEILLISDTGPLDLDIERAWKQFGADFKSSAKLGNIEE